MKWLISIDINVINKLVLMLLTQVHQKKIRLLLNNIEANLNIISNAKYSPIIQILKNNASKFTEKRKIEVAAIQYYNIIRISVTDIISVIEITNFTCRCFYKQ